MNSNNIYGKKLMLAVLPIVFVLLAVFSPNVSGQKFDNSILFLILLSVLIVVLPWERLTSLKAAGVELELDRLQIDKALGDLEVLKGKENIRDEKIRRLIEQLAPQIEQAKGSRVLWIDDAPANILGERRLLRALGIETVMATSSEMAQVHLDSDGDFDLIISDMRSGKGEKENENESIEAVQFI